MLVLCLVARSAASRASEVTAVASRQTSATRTLVHAVSSPAPVGDAFLTTRVNYGFGRWPHPFPGRVVRIRRGAHVLAVSAVSPWPATERTLPVTVTIGEDFGVALNWRVTHRSDSTWVYSVRATTPGPRDPRDGPAPGIPARASFDTTLAVPTPISANVRSMHVAVVGDKRFDLRIDLETRSARRVGR